MMERSRGREGPKKLRLSQPGRKKPRLSQPGPSQLGRKKPRLSQPFGSRNLNGGRKNQGMNEPSSMMTSEDNSCTQQGLQRTESDRDEPPIMREGIDNGLRRKRSRRIEKRRHDDREQTIASSTASSPTPPVNQDNTQPRAELVRQVEDEANSTKLKRGQRGHFKGMNIYKKTRGGKTKLDVYIPDHISQALGPNARDLANHCGYVVRTTAPPDARSWEDVFEVHGETMLKQVEMKFQLNSQNNHNLQEYCKETMHRLFRSWRSRLSTIYKSFETDEERVKHKPNGLSDEQWRGCMAMFATDEFVKRSQINSENRLKSKCRHTTGNRTFAEFEEILIKENGGVKPTTDIIWLKEHTKHNKATGKLEYSKEDKGSEEVYIKLKDMVVESTQEETTSMTQEEMLLKVFQPRSGYVRGKCNGYKGSSKRAAIADERHRQQQQTISDLRKEVKELKAQGKRQEEENKSAYENLRKEMLSMLARKDVEASTSTSVYEDIEDWTEGRFNLDDQTSLR